MEYCFTYNSIIPIFFYPKFRLLINLVKLYSNPYYKRRWKKVKGGVKMRKITLLLVFVLAIAFIGTAMAVPPGKTLEWKTKMGTVVFDGKKHFDQKLKCNECHPKIFGEMKQGKAKVKMTMKDLNAGKFCGTCHNGTKAFSTKDAKSCKKCHIQKKK